MMDLDHCLKTVANYYANMNFSPHLYVDLYNGLKDYFVDIYSTRMMDGDNIKTRQSPLVIKGLETVKKLFNT